MKDPIKKEPEAAKVVNLVEIRRASNGFVISVWHQERYSDNRESVHGYETYVVQSETPSDIGRVVTEVLKSFVLAKSVIIQPARRLP